MKAGLIFGHLNENGFLNQLNLLENILVAGDKNTVSELKTRLDGPGIEYWVIQDLDKLASEYEAQSSRLACSAIIVASITHEQAIFTALQQRVLGQGLAIPVLRLFSDVFVNFLSGRELTNRIIEIPGPKPLLSYAIITTPRSGSTYFCSLLQSTSMAGFPTEHLRQASATLALNCRFDYARAMRIIAENRLSRNRVFGTKLIAHFLQNFEHADFDFPGFIGQSFSKFIYLKRGDRVAQAVSAYLARQTNTWHLHHENKREGYEEKLKSLVVSEQMLEEINRQYKQLQSQEEYLEDFIDRYRISPFFVEYESLAQEPKRWIGDILKFLGIHHQPMDLDKMQAKTKVLSSSLSEEICEKYRAHYSLPKFSAVKQVAQDDKNPLERAAQVAEEGRFAVKQGDLKAAAACFKQAYQLDPTVKLSLQERDIEVASYQAYHLKGSKPGQNIFIRGNKFDVPSNRYFSCLGSMHARGRFVDEPYPQLLEKQLNLHGLNFAVNGAGINVGYFLSEEQRWLMDICDGGEFVVVSLMSGLHIKAGAARQFLKFPENRARKFYSELASKGGPEFLGVLEEVSEYYVREYKALADLIKKPKILLWFANKSVFPKEGAEFYTHSLQFPELIGSEVVNKIKPYYDGYVEYSEWRGMPQRLISKLTGQPVANCEGVELNTQHPSPEAHEDVAKLLLPVCQSILK